MLNNVRTWHLSSLDAWISNKSYSHWHQLICLKNLLRLLLNAWGDKECFYRLLIIEHLGTWLLSRVEHLETLLVDICLQLI